jgi:hypothetical protein
MHRLTISFVPPQSSVENVDCKLQDMMKANISSANVVVLTSLCWDEATRRAVAHKVQHVLYHSLHFCILNVASSSSTLWCS